MDSHSHVASHPRHNSKLWQTRHGEPPLELFYFVKGREHGAVRVLDLELEGIKFKPTRALPYVSFGETLNLHCLTSNRRNGYLIGH